MNCTDRLTYTIRQGDNLYQLARHFATTVPGILALNPDTNPYSLQIGSTLTICPGESFESEPESPHLSVQTGCDERVALINAMRLTWSQHVYWTRMLIISIAERLRDLDAVTARLMQNPADIGAVYAHFYTRGVADAITRLITEHLQIGAKLITALRDGNTALAGTLDREWYRNADDIAAALAGINPHYSEDDLRAMLYTHLDLTKRETAMRLAGNYTADIEAFDAVEAEALDMADALSAGIMRQFSERFA